MEIDLPQDYYLHNFIEFIKHIDQSYADILGESERHFYQAFQELNADAQKLYVRMLTRKGNTFRHSKLQYKEISSITHAAKELENKQLISINPTLNIHEVISLFNRQEWQNILAQHTPSISINKSIKRAELDEILLSHLSSSDVLDLSDTLYQIREPDIFESFKLLFFGNLHQDLSEFVLRDLGLYQYENYTIDHDSRLFQSTQQIKQHIEYYKKVELLDDVSLESSDEIYNFFQGLPDKNNEDRHLCRRLDRMYFQLARQLERLKDYDRALLIYRQCPTPEARQRIARILIEQNNIEQGLDYCNKLIESPLNEEELVFAKEFSYRQAKKHKIPWPTPQKYEADSHSISLTKDESVESAAAEYFSQQGDCYYLENALFCSVFGLHYWDLIFAPIRGAFTHPFQSRPHDLYEHDFINNREKYRQQCDRYLENEESFRQHILTTWHKKHNKSNSFLYWQNINANILTKALNTIPLEHWRVIFHRMCSDLRANRNGFPDLILFPHSGAYQLIEIKGPGDRLQKNQTRWMQYFQLHNIPHRLINIEWNSTT